MEDKITTVSVYTKIFNILLQHKAKVRVAKTNWSDYLLYLLENSNTLDADTVERIETLKKEIEEDRKRMEEDEKMSTVQERV